MKNFYNTNNTPFEQLPMEFANATKQDMEILEVFKNNPKVYFTSHDIEDTLGKYPRSSIVRSINTLTKKGFITKTNHQVIGKYGKKCFTWKLK